MQIMIGESLDSSSRGTMHVLCVWLLYLAFVSMMDL